MPELSLIPKIVTGVLELIALFFSLIDRIWPPRAREWRGQHIRPHQRWIAALIISLGVITLLWSFWPETSPQIKILQPQPCATVSRDVATFRVEGVVTGLTGDESIWIVIYTTNADKDHINRFYIQEKPARLVPFLKGQQKWFASVCITDPQKMGTRFEIHCVLANKQGGEHLKEAVQSQQPASLDDLPSGAKTVDWLMLELK